MLALSGKAALIVGLSRASLETATLFRSEGAEVFLVGQPVNYLRGNADRTKTRITLLDVDITRHDQVAEAYTRVGSAVGRVDVLFVNAGLGSFQTIEHMTENEFDRVFGTNVKATTFCIQRALPLLADGASVLISGPFLQPAPKAGFGAYNASKAALRSFVRTWALELANRRIRFNLISPSANEEIHTFLEMNAFPDLPNAPANKGYAGEQIALTALYLASDTSTAVNASQVSTTGSIRPL